MIGISLSIDQFGIVAIVSLLIHENGVSISIILTTNFVSSVLLAMDVHIRCYILQVSITGIEDLMPGLPGKCRSLTSALN